MTAILDMKSKKEIIIIKKKKTDIIIESKTMSIAFLLLSVVALTFVKFLGLAFVCTIGSSLLQWADR